MYKRQYIYTEDVPAGRADLMERMEVRPLLSQMVTRSVRLWSEVIAIECPLQLQSIIGLHVALVRVQILCRLFPTADSSGLRGRPILKRGITELNLRGATQDNHSTKLNESHRLCRACIR